MTDKKYTQPLTVEMDPRVKTSMADLQKQFDLSNEVYEDLMALQPMVEKAAAARTQLKERRAKASGADAAKLDAVSKDLTALEGGGGGRRRRGPQPENLSGVQAQVMQLFGALQEVDEAPTTQVAAAVPKVHQSAKTVMQQWSEFQSKELAPLNINNP